MTVGPVHQHRQSGARPSLDAGLSGTVGEVFGDPVPGPHEQVNGTSPIAIRVERARDDGEGVCLLRDISRGLSVFDEEREKQGDREGDREDVSQRCAVPTGEDGHAAPVSAKTPFPSGSTPADEWRCRPSARGKLVPSRSRPRPMRNQALRSE